MLSAVFNAEYFGAMRGWLFVYASNLSVTPWAIYHQQ